MKEIIATDRAPQAIGPYSQAVKAGGYLFLSGQIALDPVTGELVPGGIEAETERVMENIAGVLDVAGLDFGSVVKSTIYLVDLADFGVVNRIYGKQFPVAPPARSTVQVAALPRGACVEIEVIAMSGAVSCGAERKKAAGS
jgi:2-iminobutanoate/2-iminopropanoate deaminase